MCAVHNGHARRPHAKRHMPWQERFWRLVVRGDGCWEWGAALLTSGYGRFTYSPVRGAKVTDGAHRVAWLLANGPIPDGMFVCHHCDNKRCCRPDHLFLGTPLDNVRDMWAKGRARVYGSPRRRVVPETVAAIRELSAAGLSNREIARRHGVGAGTVSRIVNGLRWRAE
jgi:hypothetical protein